MPDLEAIGEESEVCAHSTGSNTNTKETNDTENQGNGVQNEAYEIRHATTGSGDSEELSPRVGVSGTGLGVYRGSDE